ncbi:hypothetical protein AgCh_013840 [Apium graveolens]
MGGGVTVGDDFQDMLPTMADKLGGDGLIKELCNGFRLLMDKDKQVITFESLKKNSALLGLQDLRDDELMSMLREGDVNGDGVLDEMEFCVLMFRLSPELMQESEVWLEQALHQELGQIRNRVVVTREAPRIEILKPNSFERKRDSKEVENFLWDLEQYFEGMEVSDEQIKEYEHFDSKADESLTEIYDRDNYDLDETSLDEIYGMSKTHELEMQQKSKEK